MGTSSTIQELLKENKELKEKIAIKDKEIHLLKLQLRLTSTICEKMQHARDEFCSTLGVSKTNNFYDCKYHRSEAYYIHCEHPDNKLMDLCSCDSCECKWGFEIKRDNNENISEDKI